MALAAVVGAISAVAYVNAGAGDSTHAADGQNQPDMDAVLADGRRLAEDVNSPDQLAALEDGEVSNDEYASAIANAIDCLSAAGFEIDGVGVDWSGMVYEFAATNEGRASPLYDECYDHHAGAVDMVHQLSVAPTLDAIGRTLTSCVDDAYEGGVTAAVGGGPIHPVRLRRAIPTRMWEECLEAGQSEAAPEREPLPPLQIDSE